MFTLTVYGIPNCPNCETAKRIGTEKDCTVSYVDISQEGSESRTQFEKDWEQYRKEPLPRAVPLIFIEELEQFMNFREFLSWIKTVL